MKKEGLNPTIFTMSAAVVGLITSGNFSYAELNAIGNWLILLGDYYLTYASQMYLINPNINNSNNNTKDQIDILYEAINKMKDEIDKIKKETN